MKITIKQPQTKEHTFPALYRYNRGNFSELIVLFSNSTMGMVVQEDSFGAYPVGYIGVFDPCTMESIWQRLPAGATALFEQE
jgi:hypothetical protein